MTIYLTENPGISEKHKQQLNCSKVRPIHQKGGNFQQGTDNSQKEDTFHNIEINNQIVPNARSMGGGGGSQEKKYEKEITIDGEGIDGRVADGDDGDAVGSDVHLRPPLCHPFAPCSLAWWWPLPPYPLLSPCIAGLAGCCCLIGRRI